jgi:hypothetical protein
LTHTERADVGDLVGNRALLFDDVIPPADARQVYPFSPLDEVKYRVFRVFPSFAYRANAWQYVEKLRRKLAAIGMPREGGSNEFGRIADFNALESSSVSKFDSEAMSFVAHPDRLNPANELMLRQARDGGIPVIFLLMPISPYHQATFYRDPTWAAYLQALKSLVTSQGGNLVDGSAWFQGEDQFDDRLHLKLAEKEPLTEKIATIVADRLAARTN